MTDAPLPSRGPRPVERTGAPERTSQPHRGGDSAAFRALLERLEHQAAELRANEADVRDARGLSEAAESARASFEGALALGRDLLEAFTQANLNPDAGEPDDEHPADDDIES